MRYKIPYILIFILVLCLSIFGILIPFLHATSVMPENGNLTIRKQADGTLLLSWPAAENVDSYLVEILHSDTSYNQNPLYSEVLAHTTEVLLPDIPQENVIIRVSSLVKFSVFGIKKMRCGSNPLEVSVPLTMPEIFRLEWIPNSETDTVDVKFQSDGADYCCVYQIGLNGECTQLQTLYEDNWVLSFGENGLLPIPEPDEICRLGFAACKEMPGLTLIGNISAYMEVDRQDLLDREFNLSLSAAGDNRITLTWDETKGDYYEVQRMNWMGNWEAICTVGLRESRCYISEVLPKFMENSFRVVAVGGQNMEDSAYAAISDEVHFTTRESPLYATVWPVMDMDAYFDARRSKVTARVEVGQAYCVVDERNGMFGIRVGDQICYIDSNFCMINLPEYMGNLCSYQIGNSQNSLYMVHEFEIPNVTGAVTSGYESVYQADGSYLVPLLYPTAQKLVTAAQNAISCGYKLKIYDSFRPQVATREIYNRTSAVLNREIPGSTYTGVPNSSLQLPELEENGKLSYRRVMTNNQYALNSFLAKGTSRHNLGVALDLTLEDLHTGEELRMQTSMHDLSWYSVTSRNNAMAKLLGTFMTEAGFAPLSSEWWHFQDDVSENTLSLPAVWDGIDAEGWVCDDIGWKYRNQYGVFYCSQTVQIGDTEYQFDENGYAIDGEIAFG